MQSSMVPAFVCVTSTVSQDVADDVRDARQMDEFAVAVKIGCVVFLLWLSVALLRKARHLCSVLHDVFLFWSTAVGSKARVSKMKKPMRLHTYLTRTRNLDMWSMFTVDDKSFPFLCYCSVDIKTYRVVSLEELYVFVKKMVDVSSSSGESTVLKNFQALVLSYTHVMVCRERSDGSLRGMMLIGVEHDKRGEQRYTLIKLGLVMFLPHYRGGPWMYWILLYLSLKELLLHPLTPLYHGGKAYSYKSYMIATQFNEFYPRHNRPTPSLAKAIMDNMAYSVQLPSEVYNKDTGVLYREYTHLKEYVAPVTEEELKNPHIKFFVNQNPGWMKGHCLMTLYCITWRDLFRAVFLALGKAKRRETVQTKLLKRGTSYQMPGFSRCAVEIRENGLDHIDEDYAVNTEDEDVPFMMATGM